MNSTDALSQFDLLQDFAILTESARLSIRIGDLDEAGDLLSKINATTQSLNAPYFDRSFALTKQQLISRLLERYDTPRTIQDAGQTDIEFWRYAASSGSTKACWLLVTAARSRFYPGQVPEEEQMRWLVEAARRGDAEAYLSLGEIFDEGRRFQERDHSLATEHYMFGYQLLLVQAAISPSADTACLRLGRMAENGAASRITENRPDALMQDLEQAAFWYRRSLEGELGFGTDGDVVRLRTKPSTSNASAAMINLAEVLEVSGKETSKHLLLARYRWAARSKAPFALRALADFLGRLYTDEFGMGRRLCLYRRAARKGDETSAFCLAKLQRIRHAQKNKTRPFLLMYDASFFSDLEKLLTCGEAIFVRGLYRLLLSQESNLNSIVDDFKTALSLNYRPDSYWRHNLVLDGYIKSILECRSEMLRIFTSPEGVTLRWLYVQFKFMFVKHSHYDNLFLWFHEGLSNAGLWKNPGVVAWLQLTSKLADLLMDPDKRFWNQLVVDAQLQSGAFAKHYDPRHPYRNMFSWKKIDRYIGEATARIGVCQNERDECGLPIKNTWRPRNRKDASGWSKIPTLTITPLGFTAEPSPLAAGSPSLLIEQDIWAILILAILEERSGGGFYLSLEPIDDAELPALPWKFLRKEFNPRWLAGTEMGGTMYYCDAMHVQDAHGRSTFSLRNPRITAEYSPNWRFEAPWSTASVHGSSAWNADSSRSAIKLEALIDPEEALVENGSIQVSANVAVKMAFDTSEIVWTNGDWCRRVGAGNRRYRCVRAGEYMSKHYEVYSEQYPSFQRLALLQGLYAQVSRVIEHAPEELLVPLRDVLKAKRTEFESFAAVELRDNPRNFVFDLR